MPLQFRSASDYQWEIRKIAVVGPGIVGMPMAALLAHSEIREGSEAPARVVVVQRASATSGWKVEAINSGRSVIGGVEPGLDEIVANAVRKKILSATSNYNDIADADLILVSVQTDKSGFAPDYGPLFESLDGLASALQARPKGNIPVVVFESTLAPSSMATVVREYFADRGLVEGRDILLGNSPNRVMPGRLVERVAASDKLVAGLHPLTPVLIKRVYSRIVTGGALHETNSMTAEFVKTLENAYRDVRIAFAAELVRYCDLHDIDFYAVREEVNAALSQVDAASNIATAVPTGAILVPSIGVGGHCLPKDGILLWWRRYESGGPTATSLILQSRTINDESPSATIDLAVRHLGAMKGRKVALMGTAYRFDSEDTRNSPTLSLAKQLIAVGADVVLHDPYVKADDQNLRRAGLTDVFTNNATDALRHAQLAVLCVGHGVYGESFASLAKEAPVLEAILDGANVFHGRAQETLVSLKGPGKPAYFGIGRGRMPAPPGFIQFVRDSFDVMERGVANELVGLIEFLNSRYASDEFNRVDFETVRRLAGSCVTGCNIAQPGPVATVPNYHGFSMRLARTAATSQ